MAKIVLLMGKAVLQEIALVRERVTIGRGPHNDIVINDRAVSVKHAAIISCNNEIFLEDMNSTNGTQVNGQPVRKHYLRDGDVVRLGVYLLRYVAASNHNAPCSASIKILNGSNAAKKSILRKAITTIGHSNGSTLAITCRPDGYYLTQVAGVQVLLINGRSLAMDTWRLTSGDLIELSGTTLSFEME